MAQPSLDLGRHFGRHEIGHASTVFLWKGDDGWPAAGGCCRSLGQIGAFLKRAPILGATAFTLS
jgi:hypothetical protein